MSDSDDELGNPFGIIAVGLFMFGVAWFLHSTFTDLEQSGGSITIHWIIALLYKFLGKWGAVGLFVVTGIGLFFAAFLKLLKVED